MRTLRKGAATITLRNKSAILDRALIEHKGMRYVLCNISNSAMIALRAKNPKAQGFPAYCTQTDDVIHFLPVADAQYLIELHLMLRVVE